MDPPVHVMNWALLRKFSKLENHVFFWRGFLLSFFFFPLPDLKQKQEKLDRGKALKFKYTDLLSLTLLLMMSGIYQVLVYVAVTVDVRDVIVNLR